MLAGRAKMNTSRQRKNFDDYNEITVDHDHCYCKNTPLTTN